MVVVGAPSGAIIAAKAAPTSGISDQGTAISDQVTLLPDL
jgi:hypothetical protein